MKNSYRTLVLALACLSCAAARAEMSDNVVRVGVLNDISGIFQDTNGMGSVEAARMALSPICASIGSLRLSGWMNVMVGMGLAQAGVSVIGRLSSPRRVLL